MNRIAAHVLAGSILVFPNLVSAEGVDGSVLTQILISGLSKPSGLPASTVLVDSLKKDFVNPETLNKALGGFFNSDSGSNFLKDISFKFKGFDSQREGENTSLGFSYSYQKIITDGTFGGDCGTQCARGLSLDFKADGNVAFDRNTNPNDFLDTKLSLSLYQSNGGGFDASAWDLNDLGKLTKALEVASQIKEGEIEELFANEAFTDAIKMVRDNLTDQYYVDFSGELSVESDQAFTQKQYVYGARVGFDMKSWQSLGATSWDAAPTVAKLNIFDYPFAAIRMFTGYGSCGAAIKDIGSCFVPLGTSWPTVSVGLARVSPQDNDPRKGAGDSSDFDRLNFEAAMRTPVARWEGNPISFSANYRIYHELNARASVKGADLDSFGYFVATLGPADGVFISYANGKLPLDAANDQVYTIGFKTHF